MDDIEKEYGIGGGPEAEATRWSPFDWTSETYQYMCRCYRQSLGIVNPSTYESKYYTASEHRYWKNLYAVRGYGPYEGSQRYNGKPVIKHVIPDPPEKWQHEWMARNGHKLRDSVEGTEATHAILTPEQEAKRKEFLERMEATCIKEGKEIVAISDAKLLSEFQIWLAENDFNLTEEMDKLIRDSWAHIIEQDLKESAEEYREAD